MTPQKLLAQCQQSGVTVHLNGEKIKLRGDAAAVESAASTLRPHKDAILQYLKETRSQLEPFQLDIIEADQITQAEVNRVNNMAWEFMQSDGMAFQDAIRLAAKIVVHGQVTKAEAAYADVQELWRRLKSTIADTTE